MSNKIVTTPPLSITPLVSVENVYKAKVRLKSVALHTPLMCNLNWSEKYGCNIFFKREDLQVVRSYKIRGAYNKMSFVPQEALDKGVVCASAGNHAQGVALACRLLGRERNDFYAFDNAQAKNNESPVFWS